MAAPPAEVKTHDSLCNIKSEQFEVNEDSRSEKCQLRHMSCRAWTAYLWANFSSFFLWVWAAPPRWKWFWIAQFHSLVGGVCLTWYCMKGDNFFPTQRSIGPTSRGLLNNQNKCLMCPFNTILVIMLKWNVRELDSVRLRGLSVVFRLISPEYVCNIHINLMLCYIWWGYRLFVSWQCTGTLM